MAGISKSHAAVAACILSLSVLLGCSPGFLDEVKLKITRDLSADANLKSLAPSAGVLSPAFSKDTTAYFMTVDSATVSLNLALETSFPYAKISVNGVVIGSGAQSSAIALGVGHNPVAITVTASDLATAKTYTLAICRPAVDLRKTGQVISYYAGDDGELELGAARPSPRFTVDDSKNVVTDNLTGLMWVKSPNTTNTWAGAVSYAAGLTQGFMDDWRLPNRVELRSLFDYADVNTATSLNGNGFTKVQAFYYWTSTTCQPDTARAWSMDLGYGITDFFPKTNNGSYVFPVRTAGTGTIRLAKTGQTTSYAAADDGDLETGAAWPNPRFTDNGNGTITDNLTGLMWEKAPSNTIRLWNAALDHANAMTLAGFTDWHIPNIIELESLINFEAADLSAWLQTQGFVNVPKGVLWSSTTYVPGIVDAWFVEIADNPWMNAYFFHQRKDSASFGAPYAIAVRSGR